MSKCVIRAAPVDDLETIADFNARLAEETEDTLLDPVRLEFVVRPPLGAGQDPGSGRPSAHR